MAGAFIGEANRFAQDSASLASNRFAGSRGWLGGGTSKGGTAAGERESAHSCGSRSAALPFAALPPRKPRAGRRGRLSPAALLASTLVPPVRAFCPLPAQFAPAKVRPPRPPFARPRASAPAVRRPGGIRPRDGCSNLAELRRSARASRRPRANLRSCTRAHAEPRFGLGHGDDECPRVKSTVAASPSRPLRRTAARAGRQAGAEARPRPRARQCPAEANLRGPSAGRGERPRSRLLPTRCPKLAATIGAPDAVASWWPGVLARARPR